MRRPDGSGYEGAGMSKHMPPWEVRNQTYVYSGNTYLCSIAYPRSADQRRLDGESWLDMRKRVQPEIEAIEDERRATARLIAAAPELLEALRELSSAELATYPAAKEGKVAQDAWAHRKHAAHEAARAAIAKATGEEV